MLGLPIGAKKKAVVVVVRILTLPSRKHAYIILTPYTPLLYSKTGVYKGIYYFSNFC